ncbi:MAG: hypothetical protein U0527_01445 [Candidatus Eisenbacteria bacterium]
MGRALHLSLGRGMAQQFDRHGHERRRGGAHLRSTTLAIEECDRTGRIITVEVNANRARGLTRPRQPTSQPSAQCAQLIRAQEFVAPVAQELAEQWVEGRHLRPIGEPSHQEFVAHRLAKQTRGRLSPEKPGHCARLEVFEQRRTAEIALQGERQGGENFFRQVAKETAASLLVLRVPIEARRSNRCGGAGQQRKARGPSAKRRAERHLAPILQSKIARGSFEEARLFVLIERELIGSDAHDTAPQFVAGKRQRRRPAAGEEKADARFGLLDQATKPSQHFARSDESLCVFQHQEQPAA